MLETLRNRYDELYKEIQDTQKELTEALQPRFRVTDIETLEDCLADAKEANEKAPDLQLKWDDLVDEINHLDDSEEKEELLSDMDDLNDEIDNIDEGNE